MINSFLKKRLFQDLTLSSFLPTLNSRSADCHDKILSLPLDVYLEIAERIECHDVSDLLALASTSQTMFNLLSPVLYRHVNLHTTRECHSTLDLIHRRPDLAHCILELTIHSYSDDQDTPDISHQFEGVARESSQIYAFLIGMARSFSKMMQSGKFLGLPVHDFAL
ncbi:hypothetical protein HGRIS_003836 [Hohenbuehelia grisea]|uniref:F-box domain-containing protein n=1 Tax=Hohenbuehelia grisea TaxID=104357 RepID=A0ABR3JGN8_9AGAR